MVKSTFGELIVDEMKSREDKTLTIGEMSFIIDREETRVRPILSYINQNFTRHRNHRINRIGRGTYRLVNDDTPALEMELTFDTRIQRSVNQLQYRKKDIMIGIGTRKTKEEENQLMNTVLKQNIIATAKIAQELTLE